MQSNIRISFIIVILIFLSSCKKNLTEDPLLLPPDFEVMPNLDKDTLDKKEEVEVDQDIEELRDLLL